MRLHIGGPDSDGFISTIRIDSAGDIITPLIDTLEFDTAFAIDPVIIEVGNGIYAIAYEGPDDDGFIKTVRISSGGVISVSVIDTFEFDAVNGEIPDIIEVSPGVFAIAYHGPDDDGFVVTLQID